MRRFASAALAAVLVLSAAACGGDDGGEGGEETTTSTAADTTGDDGGGSDGGTDADVAAGLLDEDCQVLLAGAFLNPLAAAVPGADADFDTTSDQLEAIAEAAPDEIEAAMATIADGFRQFAAVFEDVDLQDPQSFADPEIQAALQDLEEVFDDEYEAASQAVSDYVESNCT